MKRRVRSQAVDKARKRLADLRPDLHTCSVAVPALPWVTEGADEPEPDELDPDNTKEDDES